MKLGLEVSGRTVSRYLARVGRDGDVRRRLSSVTAGGESSTSTPLASDVRYQIGALRLAERNFKDAQRELEALIKVSPNFLEAHVALATLYYRLKRKEDGDREQAIVARLTAQKQARESGDTKQTRN